MCVCMCVCVWYMLLHGRKRWACLPPDTPRHVVEPLLSTTEHAATQSDLWEWLIPMRVCVCVCVCVCVYVCVFGICCCTAGSAGLAYHQIRRVMWWSPCCPQRSMLQRNVTCGSG